MDGHVVGQIGEAAPAELGTGHEWTELQEGPELPDTLPRLGAQGPDVPLRWFELAAPLYPGERVYGAVGGDGGAAGAYVLALYVFPPLAGARGDHTPRYPTFEEWASLAHQELVPGVMLACSYIVGSQLIAPPEGRVLIVTQSGCLPNTPAARRWMLANPGGVLGGQ